MKKPIPKKRRSPRRDPDTVGREYSAGRRDIYEVMKPGAKLTNYGRGMRDAIRDMGGRY